MATTPTGAALSSNVDSIIISEPGQVKQEECCAYAGHCGNLDLDVEDNPRHVFPGRAGRYT